jgi:diguanylate cyclase (GGDEF)-like protein
MNFFQRILLYEGRWKPFGISIPRGHLISFLIIVSLLIALTLQQQWKLEEQRTRDNLIREASSASLLMSGALHDALQITDHLRTEVEREIKSGSLQEARIRGFMLQEKVTYEAYNTPSWLDQLLLVDRTGYLKTFSGSSVKSPVDLSDRAYFSALENNPGLDFPTGGIVLARTTGKLTCHLSRPLHDSEGGFSGIVATQINADLLRSSLRDALETPNLRISTYYLPQRNLLFSYPTQQAQQEFVDTRHDSVINMVLGMKEQKGAFFLPSPDGSLLDGRYVGYRCDPILKTATFCYLTQKDFLKFFLMTEYRYLVFLFLLVFFIAYLFLRLELKRKQLKEAIDEAMLDHLTLIPNRRAMELALSRAVRDCKRTGLPLSLLFLDVDHFKNFNDRHGHYLGDTVLRIVGKTIQRSLMRPLDFCGRWGGEEFLVILPETSAEDARIVAEKIRKEISKIDIKHPHCQVIRVSASIGVASTLMVGDGDQNDLITKADQAMLIAKKHGRNRVVVYGDPFDSPERETWSV